MAGLLDALGSDEGLLGLALLSAGSAKPARTSLGEGLLGGLQLVQQNRNAREERAQRMRMQQMQEQQMRMALEDRQRQQQQVEERSRYLSRLDPNQGPPMEATPAGAMAAGLSPQEFGMLMPQQGKGPEYKVVGGRLVRIQGDDVREAYAAPEKPDFNSLIVPGPDGKPMLNQMLLDAKSRIAASGATNVSMGYGSPIAGIGPDGQPAFIMPPKDPTKAGPMILPGVKPPAGAGDKLTEDQGKATAWLAQAEGAYKNMLDAGFTKDGKPKSAAYPGPADALEKVPVVGAAANVFRSADRQKFIQASSSLSEALLRAATGAGVNMDEAKQKVAELTPQFGERAETTAQKMRAIPVYIQSLKVRAGPGAAKMPTSGAAPAADSDPLGLRN